MLAADEEDDLCGCGDACLGDCGASARLALALSQSPPFRMSVSPLRGEEEEEVGRQDFLADRSSRKSCCSTFRTTPPSVSFSHES